MTNRADLLCVLESGLWVARVLGCHGAKSGRQCDDGIQQQSFHRTNSGGAIPSPRRRQGSAFSFGLCLPVRIVSERDCEAQERGHHQPKIEHIDCAHIGTS